MRLRSFKITLALIAAAVAGPLITAGQFKATSSMVIVPVAVTDDEGRPVRNLTRSDFEVFGDGTRRRIAYFEAPSGPGVMLLAVDTSSSMEGRPLTTIRKGLEQLIQHARPDDRIGMLAFDRRLQIEVAPDAPRHQLLEAIASLEGGGGTALRDALLKGVDRLESTATPRRALVLLSDGQDHDSQAAYARLRKALAGSDVTLFAVSRWAAADAAFYAGKGKYFKLPKVDQNLNPLWMLEDLTHSTGGQVFVVQTADELVELLSRIPTEVGNRYLLGFEPETRDRSGLQPIEVRLPSQPDWQLRFRTRY